MSKPRDTNESRDSRMEIPNGTILRQTYTVVKHIGSGQFARVYLVRHRYMGMQAMKVFRPTEREEDLVEGFNEAFLLSRITHPGIVRVFDANRLDKSFGSAVYITMEYVSGGTLADFTNAHRVSISEAIDLSIQITDAVAHAHAQDPQIVHRDIKPQNLLIERAGNRVRTRVADFGLAKCMNRITEVVGSGGTILYMSPESLKGYENCASDVYSLGLTIYQLLCNCLPYRLSEIPQGATTREMSATLDRWQRLQFDPPSYFNSNVPPEIDAVILRALAHTKDHRFSDAGALRDALCICQTCLNSGTTQGGRELLLDEKRHIKAQKALKLAFQVATTPGREIEASEWLRQAVSFDPRLAARYGIYMDLWSRPTSRNNN